MKRTIPLIITALGGFALIASYFIPATQGAGEVVAIWFDILASIAFVLGGGNLLKQHLRKVSDRAAGWGYSVVTIASFLVMLFVGLFKIGAPPALDQEFYGESFAPLALSDFPVVAEVETDLPEDSIAGVPKSVSRQLSIQDGQLRFRGWMKPSQKSALIDWNEDLAWRSAIEELADEAQPPEALRGAVPYHADQNAKVSYYVDHESLAFRGEMSDGDRDELLKLSDAAAWKSGVDQLRQASRRKTAINVKLLPKEVDVESFPDAVRYDEEKKTLTVTGPMPASDRDAVAEQFPAIRPPTETQRIRLLAGIESRGQKLNPEQRKAFDKVLDATWSVEQLHDALNAAGKATPRKKSYAEMYEEQQSGAAEISPTAEPERDDVELNDEQFQLLVEFAESPWITTDQLIADLEEAGEFLNEQSRALRGFLAQQPTVGARNKTLWMALLKEGPLTNQQQDFLLADFRRQIDWQRTVYALFYRAHETKYPWSGDYRAQGTPFWWIYEYAFKPLTATMFAMLAFYVASAAFRAFRAKNFEAILLLGTAFIILLGRTFAGVYLTSGLPEYLSALRIENLTIYIMSIFNTAGTRAIMIGIALGIASTSLKVLLGVDRSYLGSAED